MEEYHLNSVEVGSRVCDGADIWTLQRPPALLTSRKWPVNTCYLEKTWYRYRPRVNAQ